MKNKRFLFQKLFTLILLPILAGFCFTLSDAQAQNKPVPIRLLYGWSPNTNYLGAYVARDKGFFAKEGLEVSIQRATEESVSGLVAGNNAEFGFSYQESVTLARAADSPLPVVAVAAVIQHNTSGFAGLRNKGIRNPKDFENKKYSAFGSPIEKPTLEDAMKPFGGDVKKVRFVPGGQIDFFQGIQRGLFDFAWVFEGWDGVAAKIKKIDLFYLPLAELNPVFDYYTPVIISSESYLKKNPEVAMRFLRAIKKGYEWSVQNPEAAAKIFSDAEPAIDKQLVKESAKYLAKKFIDDAPSWGSMKKSVWENYTRWLKNKGFVKESFSGKGSFTNRFLPSE